MKQNLRWVLTATTASLMTFKVLAQDNSTTKTGRPEHTDDRTVRMTNGRLRSAAKASDILGMKVQNYQNEKLGKVEELSVDLESGRIVEVILSTGGFIGVGDRLSAVPPGALHHDVANKVLHLDTTKEQLKRAPEFKTAMWVENSDTDHIGAVYSYYGMDSSLKYIFNSEPTNTTANALSIRDADALADKSRLTNERQWIIPASRVGQFQAASKLMGLTVKNQQDEKLGKVESLLVDVQSGRIVTVVVSSGGFLGMGDELSAVPPTAFSFNAERDTLLLNTSKEMLSAAPHFKSDQWPDFNQPAYSDSVYRAYKVEPYFTTNRVTEADDTALNLRDRESRTLTPFDQGKSSADTDTTAQIRKSILSENDMSVNGKNVKIITNNGRVTLRGAVKNADEKRTIGGIANRIALTENVDNQLEVALKTTGE